MKKRARARLKTKTGIYDKNNSVNGATEKKRRSEKRKLGRVKKAKAENKRRTFINTYQKYVTNFFFLCLCRCLFVLLLAARLFLAAGFVQRRIRQKKKWRAQMRTIAKVHATHSKRARTAPFWNVPIFIGSNHLDSWAMRTMENEEVRRRIWQSLTFFFFFSLLFYIVHLRFVSDEKRIASRYIMFIAIINVRHRTHPLQKCVFTPHETTRCRFKWPQSVHTYNRATYEAQHTSIP